MTQTREQSLAALEQILKNEDRSFAKIFYGTAIAAFIFAVFMFIRWERPISNPQVYVPALIGLAFLVFGLRTASRDPKLKRLYQAALNPSSISSATVTRLVQGTTHTRTVFQLNTGSALPIAIQVNPNEEAHVRETLFTVFPNVVWNG